MLLIPHPAIQRNPCKFLLSQGTDRGLCVLSVTEFLWYEGTLLSTQPSTHQMRQTMTFFTGPAHKSFIFTNSHSSSLLCFKDSHMLYRTYRHTCIHIEEEERCNVCCNCESSLYVCTFIKKKTWNYTVFESMLLFLLLFVTNLVPILVFLCKSTETGQPGDKICITFVAVTATTIYTSSRCSTIVYRAHPFIHGVKCLTSLSVKEIK